MTGELLLTPDLEQGAALLIDRDARLEKLKRARFNIALKSARTKARVSLENDPVWRAGHGG